MFINKKVCLYNEFWLILVLILIRVYVRLCDVEIRFGVLFFKFFGFVFCFGIVFRRRVYYEVIEYEKERNVGFIFLFGYLVFIVIVVIDVVCFMEV